MRLCFFNEKIFIALTTVRPAGKPCSRPDPSLISCASVVYSKGDDSGWGVWEFIFTVFVEIVGFEFCRVITLADFFLMSRLVLVLKPL